MISNTEQRTRLDEYSSNFKLAHNTRIDPIDQFWLDLEWMTRVEQSVPKLVVDMMLPRTLRTVLVKLQILAALVVVVSGYFSSKSFLKRGRLLSILGDEILQPFEFQSLHEGDVVLFRDFREGKRQQYGVTRFLAAVTHNKKLQQLYRRTDGDSSEVELHLYGDDDEAPLDPEDPSIHLTELVDGFQYTQRIVEDRVSNPHGEHAEDVWILSGVAAIRTVIEAKDIYIRMGPFQH